MSKSPVVVVTGGAGFIGSHMVDLLLDRGYRVHAIDNLSGGRLQNIEHRRGNDNFVLAQEDVREIQPDSALFEGAQLVFHFAGIGDIVPSIDKPVEYMSANVMGTVKVLEAARTAGVRKFVYAASSSCYGQAAELPTSESASIHAQYPYALSKYLGEETVLHWGRLYELPVNSIRIFNAYGPRSRTTGAYGAVFGVFLAQKLAGEPYTVIGDGNQKRDFVFVSDVAKAFLAAAETDRTNEIYNLGGGNPQSVNRLVELLGGEVTYIPKRPGEPDVTWADIAKAKRELGWSPKVPFEDGVQTMLENIEHWTDAPLWNPLSIQQATKTWFEILER